MRSRCCVRLRSQGTRCRIRPFVRSSDDRPSPDLILYVCAIIGPDLVSRFVMLLRLLRLERKPSPLLTCVMPSHEKLLSVRSIGGERCIKRFRSERFNRVQHPPTWSAGTLKRSVYNHDYARLFKYLAASRNAMRTRGAYADLVCAKPICAIKPDR